MKQLNATSQLGDADDFDADVDAFGLDQFGQTRGLNPMWGAAAATGVGTVTTMGLHRYASGKLQEHGEALGFVAAAVAAGTMIAMKRTRAAGWTGLAAAFLNNGLRALGQYFAPATGPWGGVVIDPMTAFSGARGLGLVEVDPTTAFRGAGLGNNQMPQLVGATLQSASDHVQLVGGPALSDIASHWGHTHFSR